MLPSIKADRCCTLACDKKGFRKNDFPLAEVNCQGQAMLHAIIAADREFDQQLAALRQAYRSACV